MSTYECSRDIFYIIFSSYFLNVYREGFVTWDPMRIKASWVDLEKEKSYFEKFIRKQNSKHMTNLSQTNSCVSW